jgi:hypothetical protein
MGGEKGMGAEGDKIRLYTSQSFEVVELLKEQNVCFVKKEYIEKKYQEVSGIFMEAYSWYTSRAQNIVKKPEGAKYPYWAFTKPEYAGMYPGSSLLTLEVPIEEAIFFKVEDWNKVLNLKYLATSEEDEKSHKNMLAKQNISIESHIFTKPFYTFLKSRVKKSWDNLFKYDELIKSGAIKEPVLQASLWELRKEWIVDIK